MKNIKQLLENTDRVNNLLYETSYNRVKQWYDEKNTAIITAYRGVAIDCLVDPLDKEEGEKYSKSENEVRNRSLKASLQKLGYGVIKIKGTWVEDFDTDKPIEYKENSFFVVDLNDDGNKFFNNLISLGQYYCQDSIILKLKGEKTLPYLYGTNDSLYPGNGNVELLQPMKPQPSQFMSYIKNKPMTMSVPENYGPNTKFLINKYSTEVFENIKNCEFIEDIIL